jgi:Rieske Fe-S protein
MSDQDLTRRSLLGGLAVGTGALALAACGGDDATQATAGPSTPEATTPAPTTPETSPDTGGGGGGDALVAVSDVVVGGGVILDDEKLVVTQPTAGEFRAFSAVCTHAGCTVSDVADNVIGCNSCHFSTFSATDGSVLSGPAPAPLPEVEVVVDGDQVVRA